MRYRNFAKDGNQLISQVADLVPKLQAPQLQNYPLHSPIKAGDPPGHDDYLLAMVGMEKYEIKTLLCQNVVGGLQGWLEIEKSEVESEEGGYCDQEQGADIPGDSSLVVEVEVEGIIRLIFYRSDLSSPDVATPEWDNVADQARHIGHGDSLLSSRDKGRLTWPVNMTGQYCCIAVCHSNSRGYRSIFIFIFGLTSHERAVMTGGPVEVITILCY